MLACELGHGAPASDAVTDNVIVELLVFLGRPEPLAQLLLDAAAGARLPSHSCLPRSSLSSLDTAERTNYDLDGGST
jgi:hypothetical protein